MRRRALLATAAAAVTAGCGNSGEADTRETPADDVTPAPVPTPAPAPNPGSLPPSEFSALHRDALRAGPHGFRRVVAVRDVDTDRTIRTMIVTIRAASGSVPLYFSFDVQDSDAYPTSPLEPFFETWYDGTTYQRFGREDDYLVTDERTFDSPGNATTDRFRVQRLLEGFESVEVAERDAGFDIVGTAVREGADVPPRRLRLLSDPQDARLEATVETLTIAERRMPYVAAYDLSLLATVDDSTVDVAANVEYERLPEEPTEPEWVQTARETQG